MTPISKYQCSSSVKISGEFFKKLNTSNYHKTMCKTFLNEYFSNSFAQLVSIFAKNENLTLSEIEELKRILEEAIKQPKS